MCGIAGVIGGDAATAEATAAAAIARLQHRGPDGVRVERADAAPGAVLAHARLSIIDLQCGWQPLHAAGCTVIGNGEIYNYLELTAQFGLADRLTTGSDFEPLLHLYAQEGPAAFARLRGMYAFCLLGHDGRAWLVRDRFGIKPLYARRLDDGGLAFASEAQALAPIAAPDAVLEELAVLGYRLSPLDSVETLAPDEVRQVAGPPMPVPTPAAPALRLPSDEAAVLDRLDAVLEGSVAVHQRSDVPYGLFLSGGVDSSVIATLMARLNSRPVTAFTCGFDAAGAADERAAAEAVASALGLDWRPISFGAEDFWRIAPLAAAALDDPTSDYACLPTYALAEAARGVLTVVLSGEGGDELFAGYGRYRRALRPRWLGGRSAEPQGEAPELPDRGAGALSRWRALAALAAPAGASPLARAQAADVATWLPADLLLKLDRMLMAHGLEGRTPFLDGEVAALAAALPDRLKVRGRFGKHILRRWLERHCPAARPWARKQGFTVPVAAWIAPHAAALGPRVADTAAVRRIADPEAVRAAFTDPALAHRRWPLLFLALWSRIHLEGAGAEEALSTLGV